MNLLDQELEELLSYIFLFPMGGIMIVAQVFRGEVSRYPGGFRRWYVRLVSPNGETLALSQGYFSKWNAKRAAKKNFPHTKLVVLD